MGRMRRAAAGVAVSTALVLSGCPEPTVADSGSIEDGALLDAGAGLDSSTTTDIATGIDTASGADRVSGVDRATAGDAGPGRDTAGGSDATLPYDAAGSSGLGELCVDEACQSAFVCVGDPGAYYCRTPCTPGDPACDPSAEYCIPITDTDGGACVPGVGPGEDCADDPCAQLYICLTPSGGTDYRCRYTCDPASTDAGCPHGTMCLAINGRDGGGCL